MALQVLSAAARAHRVLHQPVVVADLPRLSAGITTALRDLLIREGKF
jgi:hypothetical protein